MRKIDDGEKKKEKEKNVVFSGYYVIASSQPPARALANVQDSPLTIAFLF